MITILLLQGFENTNGAPSRFEPFATTQDLWQAFPDHPGAGTIPQDGGWADFEGGHGTASGAASFSAAHDRRSCTLLGPATRLPPAALDVNIDEPYFFQPVLRRLFIGSRGHEQSCHIGEVTLLACSGLL